MGWTGWTKCQSTGMIFGVPPGGEAAIPGHNGDQQLWPNPLYTAWGPDLVIDWLESQGWIVDVRSGGSCVTVTLESLVAKEPITVQVLGSSYPGKPDAIVEPDSVRRRRRALLEAALIVVRMDRR